LTRVTAHTLVRIVSVMGARVDLRLQWQGEGLIACSIAHASIVEHVVALLRSRLGGRIRSRSTSEANEPRSTSWLLIHGPDRSWS
jgi:hypothetical protein